jgi:hypothetical protein
MCHINITFVENSSCSKAHVSHDETKPNGSHKLATSVLESYLYVILTHPLTDKRSMLHRHNDSKYTKCYDYNRLTKSSIAAQPPNDCRKSAITNDDDHSHGAILAMCF